MLDNYISFEDFSKRVPEVFIPITDNIVPNIKPIYLISNYGRVYNTESNHYIGKCNVYYNQILITKIDGSHRMLMVHRLVLACFFPNILPLDNDFDVNHKNGNKNQNFINPNDINDGNLEWCTRKENIDHVYRNNLAKLGEDRPETKISNKTAMNVINLLKEEKYTSKQIVNIINDPNLSIKIVDDIRKKTAWKWLSGDVTFKQRIHRQFTEQDIHNFCEAFSIIPDEFDLSINDKCRIALSINGIEQDNRYVETLRKVYTGKYYKQISSQYLY